MVQKLQQFVCFLALEQNSCTNERKIFFKAVNEYEDKYDALIVVTV